MDVLTPIKSLFENIACWNSVCWDQLSLSASLQTARATCSAPRPIRSGKGSQRRINENHGFNSADTSVNTKTFVHEYSSIAVDEAATGNSSSGTPSPVLKNDGLDVL